MKTTPAHSQRCPQTEQLGSVASGKKGSERRLRGLAVLLAAGLLVLVAGSSAVAQAGPQVVHLAKLEIYPAQLTSYLAALKEHAETALRVEPGVLTLYPMADAAHPERITVLEIYASQAAYQAHLKSPHFLKYKAGTKEMVKSLELIDEVPLLPTGKVKN
ncbi:putative quinol monooxygenase [Hymenobacter nivis]|uniref:Antibiotic biosynthesis monooxygenase n=1 Tax=Hymenobacter nivis TaxID=1850093 RepID=A0A502GS62_9BACT|nr:putative quinol monooxygenase [Hymenobacter nivis]TPG63773.1 antibiotic biosynthesis monooxygenase [Hymenobacter nivis]